jgi:hypothetical protein
MDVFIPVSELLRIVTGEEQFVRGRYNKQGGARVRVRDGK